MTSTSSLSSDAGRPVACAPLVRTREPLRATQVLNEVFGGLDGGPHVLPLPESAGDTAWERTITHLADLPVDLTVHGWRLTGSRAKAGIAMRRAARGFNDLIQRTADDAQDAPLGKRLVTVMGPATVMCRLALPSGEPVASDRGARIDIAQAWREGITELVPAVASLPGAQPVVRIIDPDVELAFAGKWRSSSGYRTLPPLDQQWWESLMADAVEGISAQPAAPEVWVPEAARGRENAVAKAVAKAVEKSDANAAVGFEVAAWPTTAYDAEHLLETIEALPDDDEAYADLVVPLPKNAVTASAASGTTQPLSRTAEDLLKPLHQAGMEPRHLRAMTLQASFGYTETLQTNAATASATATTASGPAAASELTDLELGRGLTKLNDLAQAFTDIAHS
ncbi:hypothetical protein [Pseudoglutamicibacter cumminsii]|uniref:Uncharacterized protein n=1 Tax=Pseudoglutamicibacter cumminsii TaxID=156979 RepID=A0ABX5L907_9MICC|nr:hypothetical protein [Pseudoglutamicibacter cumminsii]PWI27372.1 hypothetical protein CAY35_07835 [Pseudoglutamicibacter cumminsii]